MERKWDEEVLKEVTSINGGKALGPDGFTLAFFIKCWNVVKWDYLRVLDQFYEDESFERSFNTTSMDLVPKKGDVVDVRDISDQLTF